MVVSIRVVIIAASLFCLSGCTTISYYSQSVTGQLEIFSKQQPIAEILDQENLPDNTRQKLQTAIAIREFSINTLLLPDNDSYRHYADLGRRYVIWNVFATPEFSLEPLQWCFLIVGCLSYRGYFKYEDAYLLQQKLIQNNNDTYVGGVAAYSTLGWFDDPILSTMLNWDTIYLARVIFHELAHQQLYVSNDTMFNESYAETVARIGLERWLQDKPEVIDKYMTEQDRDEKVVALVIDYRDKLNQLYTSNHDKTLLRQGKQRLFTELKTDYQRLSQGWQNRKYDNWFIDDLNNAKLMTLVTYKEYVDDFYQIYLDLGKNLSQFYDTIQNMAACQAEQRRAILKKRDVEFYCQNK